MRLGQLPLTLVLLACTEDPTLSPVGGGRRIQTVPDAGASDAADGSTACQPPSDLSGPLPCDIEAIIGSKCRRCHDVASSLGTCVEEGSCFQAPFPMRSLADVHGQLGQRVIYEAMYGAVESAFMPLQSSSISPPVEPLTDDERERLLSWLGDCAPAGSDACN